MIIVHKNRLKKIFRVKYDHKTYKKNCFFGLDIMR